MFFCGGGGADFPENSNGTGVVLMFFCADFPRNSNGTGGVLMFFCGGRAQIFQETQTVLV